MLLEVKTIENDGTPAVHRIGDAHSAYNIFQQMMTSQAGEALLRCHIKNIFDGNRPYSDADQKRKGRAWESNVSTGSGRSILHKRVLSFWKLLTEVEHLVTFRDVDDYQQSGTQDVDRTAAEDILAEEYTRTVRSWNGWVSTMLQTIQEFVAYGKGPLIFPNAHDWRPKSMQCGNLLVPLYTRMNEERELIMLRDYVAPHQLFEMISTPLNRKRATSLGWNCDMIEQALLMACKAVWREDQTQTSAWESFQMKAKANDFTMTAQTPLVRVVQILVREVKVPFKVSRYIIFEDNILPDFMFKKENYVENISDVLHVFFYDNGDGFERTVKGLGHRVANLLELDDRAFNTAMNAFMLAGSMVLKVDGDTASAFAATRFGPFTIVPRNFNPVQSSFQPNLQSMADLRHMLQSTLQTNEGVYSSAQTSQRGKTPVSSAQIQTEAQEDTRIEANQGDFFFAQLDRLHLMMFQRLLNPALKGNMPGAQEAKDFRDRCLKRGVPKEMLKTDRYQVKAARAIGNGSPILKEQVLNKLVNLSPSFPEEGRYNALRDSTAAMDGIGYERVDRYLPRYKLEANQDEHSSVARLENIAMKNGEIPLVAANQPHVPHAMECVSMLDALVQAHDQAQDGQFNALQAMRTSQLAMDHINQHLKFLAMDTTRQQALKTILGHLKQLVPHLNQIRKEGQAEQKKQLEEQQAQQQAQQQQQGNLTPDQMAAMKKVQGDLQIKLMKAQGDEKLKWQKTLADIARRDKVVEAQIALNERKQLALAGTAPSTPMVTMPQGPMLPMPGVRQ